ncbi:MAG: cation transporter [Magnetococcales bacterium]|nr:cation transporter [Magnetococcales bacterium]
MPMRISEPPAQEETDRRTTAGERYREGDRALLVGAVVNVLLTGLKVVAGLLGNSAALVADGIHSLADLVSDAAVWLSGRISRQGPDAGHPYGHGGFETLAVLFIGVLTLAVGIGIAVDAVARIESDQTEVPTRAALVVVILSILAKEILYHYTRRVGERYNLRALVANAWHHRSDAISSVAALVGIGGAMLGWPALDPIAAVLVAVILGKVSLDMLRDALREFTHAAAAIDQAISNRIGEMVQANPDVYSAHLLKARRSGPDIFVDVHAVVNPFLSVSEGHQIAEQMRRSIIRGVPEVTDVLVHVDAEDDQQLPTPIDYPNRQALRERITPLLANHPELPTLADLMLHYSREGVVVDLVVTVIPEADDATTRQAAARLCNAVLTLDRTINNVRLKRVLHGCDRGFH